MIQETLQGSFNRERFVFLIKNVLNHVEEAPFTYKGNYIFDDFADSIRTVDRIGKFKDQEDKLVDILIVHLRKETSLERARTKQRNFVAKYLKGSRGGVLKDAALVAFVSPDGDDWRFSLVKMEYKFNENGKVEEEFTPARRYSFLVGKKENSHTAQSRLLPLLLNDEVNPTLHDLENVFSVEQVTKEFFEKYRDLFLRLKESLDDVVKKDAKVRADLEHKNIETVDFAKKLLGQIVFLYFLQKKGWFGVQRGDDWGLGSKHFLREIFDKKHGDYKNFFNDILEPLFYEALAVERSGDYYSPFNCRIPFLNGGLFDPINDYDWWDTDILLPEDLFSNDRQTKEGDVGDGILDIFDRYNFTVKEDEPLEKEVAVDPEMLGKVFENLLEVKDRKSKGTYYTPREIVHYMCQESLTNYVVTELDGKVSEEEIGTLIEYGESVVEHDSRVISEGRETKTYAFKLPSSVRKNAKLIDEALASIRVCDPAVGSGAFPVGMMNEIVRARNALTTYIGVNGKRSPYHFKRQAIQNCLYGVDIDPGAIEITKLRLWLSLIVDEEEREKIQPLPNLDYKIVHGNSLLSVEKNLLNLQLFNELEELKPLYFNETSARKKQKYKKQIDTLINQMTSGHEEFDFEVFFSEVFHEKKGFDVVIANPPYVEHKKLAEISKELKKFKTYSGRADLYVYFYEIALNIMKEHGLLCFISSNKFTRTSYGEKLREYLCKQNILDIIDFSDIHIFDALVATLVILLKKEEPSGLSTYLSSNDEMSLYTSLKEYVEFKGVQVPASTFNKDMWIFEDPKKIELKTKIDNISTKLINIQGVSISRGITTGLNEAFIIDSEQRSELINVDPNSMELIKPLLQGRNIKRWAYQPMERWLIVVKHHFHSQLNKYPAIHKHLLRYELALKKRGQCRINQHHWLELDNNPGDSYLSKFSQEKIIWGLTANSWAFALDKEGYFLPSNGYVLTSNSLDLKFLLGVLNSRLSQYYFGFIGIMTAGGAFTLKHETIGNMPIKEVPPIEQKPIVELVDEITDITKDEGYLNNSSKMAKLLNYEKQINELVYKIYGLNDEDIKIIEEHGN